MLSDYVVSGPIILENIFTFTTSCTCVSHFCSFIHLHILRYSTEEIHILSNISLCNVEGTHPLIWQKSPLIWQRRIPVKVSAQCYYERSAKRGAKFFLTYGTKLSMSGRPASNAFEKLTSPKLCVRAPRGFHCRVEPL